MTRGLSWFDERMLPRGEDLIFESHVRLHTDAPPFRWDGSLVLTSERLFFLPHIDNPALGRLAFWLSDIRAATYNAHAFYIRGPQDAFALFEPIGARIELKSTTHRVARWLQLIGDARHDLARAAAASRAAG